MFIKNFTKIFTKDFVKNFANDFARFFTEGFTKKHLYSSIFIISLAALICSYAVFNNISNKQNFKNSSAAADGDTVILMSESTVQKKSSVAIASDNAASTSDDAANTPGAFEQGREIFLKNNTESASSNSTESASSALLMAMDSSPSESEGIQAAEEGNISRGGERLIQEMSPAGGILKKGSRSEEVTKLQQNLQKLGFFNAEPTGYFGEITRLAVINFQKSNSLVPDGVAGAKTLSLIEEAVNNPQITAQMADLAEVQSSNAIFAAEDTAKGEIQLIPWFGEAENIYSIGSVATVIDVYTGLSMQVKRTYGYNHADVETLTAEDTEILRTIAGGEWNWTRRPVIVEINGYRIAGSMTAMPHAGRDDMPANAYVDGRSGGYGYGANLDAVKGNGMDGQFDIHFYGSKTHSSNRVNEAHQNAIQIAYKSGL